MKAVTYSKYGPPEVLRFEEPAKPVPGDNEVLIRTFAELAGSGKLKPVIDRQYSVDEIVEAHRYVDSGRKKGNVVILWDTLGESD